MSELWCLGPLALVLPGPGGLRPDALLSPAAPELPPSRGRASGAGEGRLQPGRGTSKPPPRAWICFNVMLGTAGTLWLLFPVIGSPPPTPLLG